MWLFFKTASGENQIKYFPTFRAAIRHVRKYRLWYWHIVRIQPDKSMIALAYGVNVYS